MEKKRAIQYLARTLLFLAGLAVLYYFIQKPFRLNAYNTVQRVTGFYKQEKKSLDGVYIGGSNVYSYWQPTFGWDEYGITVYTLSVPSMPPQSVRFMIEEARKTQPDALYIVNLNSFRSTKVPKYYTHYTVDYMKNSWTKWKLVDHLVEAAGKQGEELDRMEYLLPMIRFHSGWNKLDENSFDQRYRDLRGSSENRRFLQVVTDYTDAALLTEDRVDPTEEQVEVLRDLMQYCREQEVNILFVVVPQMQDSPEMVGQMNSLADYAEREGFSVLNLWNRGEEIELDPARDFYSRPHTNIHGSLKYSHYLGKYLMEQYGWEDKRGSEAYKGWDRSAQKYERIAACYALDFELDHAARDYSLQDTRIEKIAADKNGGVRLEWSESPGADYYLIYRKAGKFESRKEWQLTDEVPADTLSYLDEDDVKEGKTYTYCVVPASGSGTDLRFGTFDYKGAAVKIKKK